MSKNQGDEGKELATESSESPRPALPRCPKCKFVMCEQFDTQRINDHADLATPNGTYICYTCTPPKRIDIRTCLSCSICELSVTKSCCDLGFCDGHYAMHVEVAARFHHGITTELLRVARMALQQFEFTYGKRKRGWDAAFLMDELQTAITSAERNAPARDAETEKVG